MFREPIDEPEYKNLDDDDILSKLKNAAECTWPNHLLISAYKEIQRLRNENESLKKE